MIANWGAALAVLIIVFLVGYLLRWGLEPAGLGKAIIFGPHTFNFAEPVRALLEAEAAFQIAGPAELSPVLQRLLGDPGLARTVGQRAQKVILDRKGATEKHMKLICRILGKLAQYHPRSCASPVDKAGVRQARATSR